MKLDAATLRFVEEHGHDDVRRLALQASRFPEVDMPMALVQIAGRQAAAIKVPSLAAVHGVLYPPHLSMEQCSSEPTARYKASLVEGHRLADLTGGFGIDSAFLARRFAHAVYVERQPLLCELARHNFPLWGLPQVEVHTAEASDYLEQMEPVDWIFLDPARRDHAGGKTVAIADCEPDVRLLEERLLQKSPRVLLKLSPMLDVWQACAELHRVAQVHIVAVGGECKELLLVLERDACLQPADVPVHAVTLQPDGTACPLVFTRRSEQESPCTYATLPATYLYEPHAALLKGGAFRTLSYIYKVDKLHPNSHLYTSHQWIPTFPGRSFRVESYAGFGKRELKSLLTDLRQANLTVRNFPASVADLRKRLHLGEGGDTYLFATTLAGGEKVLIRCRKPEVSVSSLV